MAEDNQVNMSGGVVNHGFSDDVSSEEDHHMDRVRHGYLSKNSLNTTPNVSSNLPSICMTEQVTGNETVSVEQTSGKNGDKWKSFSNMTTERPSSDSYSAKDTDEDTHSPIPHQEHFVPNPAHEVSEDPQECTRTGNKYTKDLVIPKAYFRDVRLSLDMEKKPVPDVNFGRESFCSECSNESVLTSSDSVCDSCKTVVLNNYKIGLQYVVENPLFCFAIWALFYIYWGEDALPEGSLFALTVLELSALFLGYIAELLQFPGLLGMMAAGLILRNVPYIDVAKNLKSTVASPLRGTSIVILLIRGALSVNPVNINKFKNIISPLVIGSCVLEAVALSLAIHFIIGFPVAWASLMGCIMSAMSGVAVLPYLAPTEKFLSLQADPCVVTPNYQKVIAIVRTSCGLDAMIAICMTEVALGFIFGDGSVGNGLVKGAVEVLMGGVFGIFWGCIAAFLVNETSSHEKRTLVIFSCGVMSLLGFSKIGYPRAGPLAVYLGVLIATQVWKRRQVGGTNNEQLSASFTQLWFIFQPLLFGIIGARIDINLVNWTFVTKGLICLCIGISVRCVTAFLTTNWGKLSLRERLYISIAWIPKGTVQAALGPIILDTAASAKNLDPGVDFQDMGNKVMYLSAVSLIATATIGCFLLRFIGPRLLASK